MKHPQFRAREFRGFIEPTRALPKLPGSVVPLSQSQTLSGLALSLQLFFELDPFRRVFYNTVIAGSDGVETARFNPAIFVVKLDPTDTAPEPKNGVITVGPKTPGPEFVFEVSPPGFRGWRDLAVKYVENCGAREIFFHVPGAPSHLAFRAFQMKGGELAVVSQWSKLWHSSTLNIDFAVRDDQPVAFNPLNGERLTTPIDWFHKRFPK